MLSQCLLKFTSQIVRNFIQLSRGVANRIRRTKLGIADSDLEKPRRGHRRWHAPAAEEMELFENLWKNEGKIGSFGMSGNLRISTYN
jgi:hypothetical protein